MRSLPVKTDPPGLAGLCQVLIVLLMVTVMMIFGAIWSSLSCLSLGGMMRRIGRPWQPHVLSNALIIVITIVPVIVIAFIIILSRISEHKMTNNLKLEMILAISCAAFPKYYT